MRDILLGVVMWLGLQGGFTPAATGVSRIAGADAGSGIAYVLISGEGRLAGAGIPAGASVGPRLTAQCTKAPDGKLRFELLADFGGVDAVSYVPPWKPKQGELFPPPVNASQVTMEFLGYTKVKPVKREWDAIAEIPGEWKYATPALASKNLEQVMFYLQYLRALPTLRLTPPGRAAAEWETTAWQDAVKAEPLCAASGL